MKQLIIIIAVGLLFSCNKPKNRCYWTLPPNVFFFIVQEDGLPLADSVNTKLRMYYLEGEEKIYRFSPTSDDTTFLYPGVRGSGSLAGSKVLCSGYMYEDKTWYLEFPDGDVDTVVIRVTELDCEAAKKDPCYCYKPYTSVQFNGVSAPEYTEEQTDDGKKIFLFDK